MHQVLEIAATAVHGAAAVCSLVGMRAVAPSRLPRSMLSLASVLLVAGLGGSAATQFALQPHRSAMDSGLLAARIVAWLAACAMRARLAAAPAPWFHSQ
jgi:hypothetical protein